MMVVKQVISFCLKSGFLSREKEKEKKGRRMNIWLVLWSSWHAPVTKDAKTRLTAR